MIRGFFTQFGGGSGDVWVDVLDSPSMRLLPGLVEDYGFRIRVHTCCHCPGVEDLFRYQPHVHEVITEPWRDPREVDPQRFIRPTSDGFYPMLPQYLNHFAGPIIRQEPFTYRYSLEEQGYLDHLLTSDGPVICLQMYAGLSDRDGCDPERLALLCQRLVDLDPACRVLVLGKNHERGHKYQEELCPFDHPRVLNLIDKLGLRVPLALVERCDAFGGCHSNLIRQAWRCRKRNVCVLPSPSMTDALPQIDARYTYGFKYPETKVFTYFFDNQGPRDFTVLDVEGIAQHLLGR